MTHPFLIDVEPALLKAASFSKKVYTKGMTVHAQGECCTAMDLVLSGSLVAYSLSQNGSENIVFEFKKHSAIGANLLFGNANHYPMNIYCTEDCEILSIERAVVELLLQDHGFTMNFVKNLSLNAQGLNRKIAMYTQKTLRDNLIDYLKALSIEQNSTIVTLPISKKQLADYLGVKRPSLFREFKKMKDEGLIMVELSKIRLL